MPQNTGRYRLVYWLVGDPAEIHTATQRLAASVDSAMGVVEDSLRALIASTNDAIQNQISSLSTRINDARTVRSSTVQGSGGAQSVATSGAGVSGLAFDIPAGYGASYVAIFDVRCSTFSAGSVFLGTVNSIDRRTNTPTAINGQARFEATAAGQLISTTTMNTVPAADYVRTLQPIVAKSGNGGYDVTPAGCRLQVLLTRTGSL